MSHRNRRQSAYLARNSIIRSNSYDARKADSAPVPPPDIKSMKVYKGYEFVTFKPEQILPSEYMTMEKEIDSKDENETEIIELLANEVNYDWITKCSHVAINKLNQNEARECLYKYVNEKCCYGIRAAQDMTILDMDHSFILIYSLESVCERRQLCWTFEPYSDMDPAAIFETPPHNPWDITVNQLEDLQEIANKLSLPNTPESDSRLDEFANCNIINDNLRKKFQEKLFQDRCIETTVPGTISIYSCHVCSGVGRKRCIVCQGSGSVICDVCQGIAFALDHQKSSFPRTLSPCAINDYCWRCRSRGKIRCESCIGIGMIVCSACAGSGQIKCFIKMTATLTNHHNSIIIRDHHSLEIPIQQVKLASGYTIFNENGCDFCPNSEAFDDLISKASQKLLKLHRGKYIDNSKLLLQRHQIKAIPVLKVNSFWRGHRFRFYVYSRKPRKCHTIDYPQSCCCGCCCLCQII